MVFPALIYLAMAFQLVEAGERVSVVDVRTFVDTTDAILVGTIEDTYAAPGGLWHRLAVEEIVWGETTFPSVLVFAHGPGIPESVDLVRGDQVVLGLRWLSSDAGRFHRKLLQSLDGIEPGGSAGLAAPDGAIILPEGETHDAFIASLRTLVSIGKNPNATDSNTTDNLLDLSEGDNPDIRSGAIRLLAMRKVPLTREAHSRIHNGFSAEVRKGSHGHPEVLKAYLQLVEARNMPESRESIRQLVVNSDDRDVFLEGLEAFVRRWSQEDLAALVASYETAGPGARGRILRALARIGWEGTLPLVEEALEADEPIPYVAAVEALGDVVDPRSVKLLERTLGSPFPFVRQLAIQGLVKHRTPESIRVLKRALSKSRLSSKEKLRIRRSLSRLTVRARR